MFGLDPEVFNLVITCWTVLVVYFARYASVTKMKKVVNWEEVAELEHLLGIEHIKESAEACTDNTTHIDDMTLGELTNAVGKAMEKNVWGPNEKRLLAALESIAPPAPHLSGAGVETLTRALAFGALGPNEIRAVVDKCCENYWPCDSCRKKNDSRQMGLRRKDSYGRRLNHIYPQPGEPGYPPRPPRGNAGCSP